MVPAPDDRTKARYSVARSGLTDDVRVGSGGGLQRTKSSVSSMRVVLGGKLANYTFSVCD